jgi:hypothetical protein
MGFMIPKHSPGFDKVPSADSEARAANVGGSGQISKRPKSGGEPKRWKPDRHYNSLSNFEFFPLLVDIGLHTTSEEEIACTKPQHTNRYSGTRFSAAGMLRITATLLRTQTPNTKTARFLSRGHAK